MVKGKVRWSATEHKTDRMPAKFRKRLFSGKAHQTQAVFVEPRLAGAGPKLSDQLDLTWSAHHFKFQFHLCPRRIASQAAARSSGCAGNPQGRTVILSERQGLHALRGEPCLEAVPTGSQSDLRAPRSRGPRACLK